MLSVTVPGSASGLLPGNRTEGSTWLYNIVSSVLHSIPFPVDNPAKLGNEGVLCLYFTLFLKPDFLRREPRKLRDSIRDTTSQI